LDLISRPNVLAYVLKQHPLLQDRPTSSHNGSISMLRRLAFGDMDLTARIHRVSFDHALPTLAGLHTADEDRCFYRERMFRTCQLWGAFDASEMLGIIAFRDGWIDQLYVLPSAQRRGVGSKLLKVAQREFDQLHLWTFQRNIPARRFYAARGFVLVTETAGVRNEEKEPDALYRWARHVCG
jgi:GNAT superfamily N-acetyltransferase